MGSSTHKRGIRKGEFCSVPGTPCECGNDYIKGCKPGWGDWTFTRLVKRKTGKFTFQKKYEAHHILCVSCVAKELQTDPGIESVAAATKWCINNEDNMIGMPLWGHTVMWYCENEIRKVTGDERDEEPDFKDIPQHDWDHNCKLGYTHEISKSLRSLKKKIKAAGHDVGENDLASRLDTMAGKWRKILGQRGGRDGGTHAGWLKGMDDPTSQWYTPFSMASKSALTKKGFPVRKFDKRTAKWIERIAKAILGG